MMWLTVWESVIGLGVNYKNSFFLKMKEVVLRHENLDSYSWRGVSLVGVMAMSWSPAGSFWLLSCISHCNHVLTVLFCKIALKCRCVWSPGAGIEGVKEQYWLLNTIVCPILSCRKGAGEEGCRELNAIRYSYATPRQNCFPSVPNEQLTVVPFVHHSSALIRFWCPRVVLFFNGLSLLPPVVRGSLKLLILCKMF